MYMKVNRVVFYRRRRLESRCVWAAGELCHLANSIANCLINNNRTHLKPTEYNCQHVMMSGFKAQIVPSHV